MTVQGRESIVEAFVGVPPDVGSTDWVDITDDNRTDFNVSIVEGERPRNAGKGRTAHDLNGHASGTVGFTLDSTSVTRPLFAAGGGRRLSFRYSPEGNGPGNPWTTYQCIIGVNKAFGESGAVVYTVAGSIETEPQEDVYV